MLLGKRWLYNQDEIVEFISSLLVLISKSREIKNLSSSQTTRKGEKKSRGFHLIFFALLTSGIAIIRPGSGEEKDGR